MANAHYDFVIENISPENAEVLMDFIDLYAKSHGCARGGGYLMVDDQDQIIQEAPDGQDS